MKIRFYCLECSDGRPLRREEEVFLTPVDSGLYEVRCLKGHVNPCVLQQTRFEILFDIGVFAIRDNYYREAISSFSSSLERFLQFYIRFACREREIPEEEVKSIWKQVANQSERQLGAYLFLYLANEQAIAPNLSQKMTELRNAVVHKGKIPTRQEAVAFGNAALAVINPIARRLKSRRPDIVLQIVRACYAL